MKNKISVNLKIFYTFTFLILSVITFLSCNVDKNNGELSTLKDNPEVVEYTERTIQELLPSFFMAPNIIKVGLGDFDMMFERRVIRVLVPYSRTLFFNDKGRERGITAETVREFELFLNQKYRSKLNKRPITITIIPTPRDHLFTSVFQGLGDIAAGNITVTEKRLEMVDFIAPPELPNISEIILTRKQDEPITSLEDLSGKTVHVRVSSSYYESLQKINKKFAQTGKSKVNIVPISEYLEDEDLMEMLDAGIISMIAVDDWKAKMWAQILNNIVVNDSIAIRTNGNVGWAYRKNSPLLLAELKEFYYKFEKNRQAIPHRFKKYSKQVKQLQDPTKQKSWKRYQETIKLFEKYGSKFEFDALMLAALGFQESQLDQSKRSHVGAIGVMQLMPETGASMRVGDVSITENNIHAGTKYLNTLMTQYFKDAHFDEFNKCLFVFASYNAGPNRIANLREVARSRGLNPDVWLKNVEIVVAERVGWETTTYVRNITKYYFSYKLMQKLTEEQQKARSEFK